MEKEIKVSLHAYERFKERISKLDVDQVSDYAEKSIQFGRDMDHFDGQMAVEFMNRKFLSRKTMKNQMIKIYKGVIFIFYEDSKCLYLKTVYQFPNRLGTEQGRRKKWKKEQERAIKNKTEVVLP